MTAILSRMWDIINLPLNDDISSSLGSQPRDRDKYRTTYRSCARARRRHSRRILTRVPRPSGSSKQVLALMSGNEEKRVDDRWKGWRGGRYKVSDICRESKLAAFYRPPCGRQFVGVRGTSFPTINACDTVHSKWQSAKQNSLCLSLSYSLFPRSLSDGLRWRGVMRVASIEITIAHRPRTSSSALPFARHSFSGLRAAMRRRKRKFARAFCSSRFIARFVPYFGRQSFSHKNRGKFLHIWCA